MVTIYEVLLNSKMINYDVQVSHINSLKGHILEIFTVIVEKTSLRGLFCPQDDFRCNSFT